MSYTERQNANVSSQVFVSSSPLTGKFVDVEKASNLERIFFGSIKWDAHWNFSFIESGVLFFVS